MENPKENSEEKEPFYKKFLNRPPTPPSDKQRNERPPFRQDRPRFDDRPPRRDDRPPFQQDRQDRPRFDDRPPRRDDRPPFQQDRQDRPRFDDRPPRRPEQPQHIERRALLPEHKIFVATTLHGLEDVLAAELVALGAANIKMSKRAVQFEGDERLMYRANLELRTAVRVLIPVAAFRYVRTEEQLYEVVRQIDWTAYITVKQTLAVDAVTAGEFFKHSKYASLKTKDAVVDQFRDKFGVRPNIQLNTPALRVHVFINEDVAEISLDASGDSLHKRGYRAETLEAPLNEVLAAGMLKLAGWDGTKSLIDPMCGSGTLLTEAAMMARNIAPQSNRNYFGFHKWKNFEERLWHEVTAAAKAAEQPFEHQILGFDKHFQAVGVAQRNVSSANLDGSIHVERRDFEKLVPPVEGGMLIMNPPYDERLASDDINGMYKMIGERFKRAFVGYEAWLISSNVEAIHNIGLHATRKIQLFNGALECRFLKYEMYEGSKKNPTKDPEIETDVETEKE